MLGTDPAVPVDGRKGGGRNRVSCEIEWPQLRAAEGAVQDAAVMLM